MTPLFPAQRAAEEFDQVLAGTADPAVTARYAELFDAVEQLRAMPELTPRAEFVGDLRSRLMTAAESELVVTRPKPVAPVTSLPEVRARRRHRRIGTIAASLVVVGGTAGMAAAASGALPGDHLYPVKRGIEQVTTAVHFGEASHGKALLGQAATRLEEVRALQAEGSAANPDLIASTLDDFNTAADSGSKKLFDSYSSTGNKADISAVRDFTTAQMADVALMTTNADTATNDLLLDAADTLADIDEQARGLCAACDPTKSVTPPQALSAGAGAAGMDNLIARPVQQAQSDVAAVKALKAAQAAQQTNEIKKLQASAEAQAGSWPTLGSTDPNDPSYVFPGSNGQPGQPLSSVVTPDGKLLPTVTSGVAVKDLVAGVTGTVDKATGGASAPLTAPLGKAVKKAGDALGDATGTVLP